MPKESLNLPAKVEAQKELKKEYLTSLPDAIDKVYLNKIDYPDSFKELTPEVKKMLLLMNDYQELFSSISKSASSEILNGRNVDVNFTWNPGLQNSLMHSLWDSFKSQGLTDGTYSDSDFYNTVIFKLPQHLAEYGISFRMQTLRFDSKDSNGNPKFDQNEILFELAKVARIKREDVEQGGVQVHRDLIYLDDFLEVNGVRINSFAEMLAFQAKYKNIFVLEKAVDNELDFLKKQINANRQAVEKGGGYEAGISFHQSSLEENNSWDSAAGVASLKILQRFKYIPTREVFADNLIEHETRHLIDSENPDFDLRKYWVIKEETPPVEALKIRLNHRIHLEINPLLVELASGPSKNIHLSEYIDSTVKGSKDLGAYKFAHNWIIRRIIEMIAKNPKNYGISIDRNSRVSRQNQILSQLDLLLDKPDLLEKLCYEIIALHNRNLGENIAETSEIPVNVSDLESEESLLSKLKVPAEVIGGMTLAGLGLEALRRRKNKIAREKMTRQQRNQEERKKGKKAKK